MSEEKQIHITVNPDIIVRESPDMEQVNSKAVAGVSEKELIERNVLGEYKEDEDEQSGDK